MSISPPPQSNKALADRLEAEVKRLDDTPPSLQTQANIRLINAVHEAVALLRGTPSPSPKVMGGSSFIADVHAVVDGMDFGNPTAEKRGRTSDLPYVPVIDHGDRTEQIKGFAFPDRAAAIEHAAKTIAFRRAYLFQQLKEPRLRALRQSHGLPADISATPAPQPRARGSE